MKIRITHVTNSSSSSFIIGRSNISDEQIKRLEAHMIEKEPSDNNNYKYGHPRDWRLTITKDYVKVETMMDNYPLDDWIVENLGIPFDKFERF